MTKKTNFEPLRQARQQPPMHWMLRKGKNGDVESRLAALSWQAQKVGTDDIRDAISEFILDCESPIEKQMAVALFFAQWPVNSYTCSYSPVRYGTDFPCLMGKTWDHNSVEIPESLWETVIIAPQQVIGNYRADLLVLFVDRFYDQRSPIIKAVVECDGHDFHERTKEQAARDKKRDREMQAMGYHVFRFTGSEIFNNADKCAADVVSHLTSLRKLSEARA